VSVLPPPVHAGAAPALLRPQDQKAGAQLYLEGNGFRRIGRLLSVNHHSAANWVNSAHAQLPAGGVAADTLEMDELLTFVGAKMPA
jgi:hypothetical protein